MPEPSYWAKAERDGDALTITVHIEDVPKHHPNNFAGAAVGLATIGVSLCVPTDDARGVLEALARGGDGAR